ncbi:hypothetical protein FOJ82_04720 [Tessaracoccus rhinocerotis]|uniref:(d)CMP kinase n=1 Tax=Tessaracoccus rhinocerotis TaxID=1689449 RepID=A0A553K632_9ACTN|nr:hypothetical protein [Tessaracoccus rhinocerotis]TRY20168.1 hypothetical protein FOJ82_04720 [Tessaracoccus rhinocerotis]
MHQSLTSLLDTTRPGVVAVDGPSGSGKTTYAEVVAGELARRTGARPQVVHMDDVYPGWDGLAEAVGLVTEWVLAPHAAGRHGGFRRWDWVNGTRGERIEVPWAPWIVLEGVAAGSAACREHLTALIWLEADAAVRMARGIERDGEAYRPHWERWARQEQELFAREDTRAHADLVIRT